jgi:hypothetical protein
VENCLGQGKLEARKILEMNTRLKGSPKRQVRALLATRLINMKFLF